MHIIFHRRKVKRLIQHLLQDIALIFGIFTHDRDNTRIKKIIPLVVRTTLVDPVNRGLEKREYKLRKTRFLHSHGLRPNVIFYSFGLRVLVDVANFKPKL
jgi:hypothetical protein